MININPLGFSNGGFNKIHPLFFMVVGIPGLLSPADKSLQPLGKNAPYEPHDLVSGVRKLGNELTAELTAGRKWRWLFFFLVGFVQGFFYQ